jgi:hypothetical protein
MDSIDQFAEPIIGYGDLVGSVVVHSDSIDRHSGAE